MIDWASGFIKLRHKTIDNGFYIDIDENGVVNRKTAKYGSCEGSHSSNLIYKSEQRGDGATDGYSSHLYFSFNPSKFLQGHNVLGSDDLVTLLRDSLLKLFHFIDIFPNDLEYHAIKNGDIRLTRIDINYAYELNTYSDVLSFIRAAEFTARTRHGRPSLKGSTLYFGKTSNRWTLKMYSKALEILKKDRQLPLELNNKHLLEDWVQNKLRIELTLRSKELIKNGLEKAYQLNEKIPEIYQKYLGTLNMNKQIRLSDDILLKLPSKLRSTYLLWQNGDDVIDGIIVKKSTFYRHRKELLEYGIDITFPMRDNADIDYSNVVPMLRVLEAQPSQVPDWAYEHKLIHCL